MSRGFVKEDDLEHAGTDVPERLISKHPNYVTPNGYKLLQAEAAKLEQALLSLKNQKDDQQVQQQLAIINRDLRYLAARLESALLTKLDVESNLTTGQVLFGATVTVENEAGLQHSYEIVGEDEADIKANKVSWNSPLAKALIGHKVDENVVWARPAGNQTLTITNIEYL